MKRRPPFVAVADHLHDPLLRSVYDHALRFRQALILAGPDDCAPNLRRFPKDCCHHASKLLALYFYEKTDLGVFDTVEGEHNDIEHVWLEQNGVIVDITADQFRGLPPVVVTRKSNWHEAWKKSQSDPAGGFPAFIERVKSRYAPVYKRILAHLQHGNQSLPFGSELVSAQR